MTEFILILICVFFIFIITMKRKWLREENEGVFQQKYVPHLTDTQLKIQQIMILRDKLNQKADQLEKEGK